MAGQKRRRWLGLGGALFVACCPATAGASTVSSTDILRFAAEPGEANKLSFEGMADGGWLIRDAVPLAPGAGCVATDQPTAVRCVTPARNSVSLDLGDLDDQVLSVLHASYGAVRAGDGNDVVDASLGNGLSIDGGAGDDTLIRGQPARGGPGADTIIGGVASYAERTAPVVVTLGDGPNDGEPGERDDVSAGSYALGGWGADTLTGNAAGQTLAGGPGDDRIVGGAGNDRLDGGGGGDVIDGGAGLDSVYGGDGPGRLDGGPGQDAVVGGPGPDVVTGGSGPDFLVGGGGGDLIEAQDDAVDFTTCSESEPAKTHPAAGHGRVDRGDLVQGCRRVTRQGAAFARLIPAWRDSGGVNGPYYYPRIGCPQDMPRACEGSLRIVRHGSVTARARVRVEPGVHEVFRVRAREAVCSDATAKDVLRTRDSRGRVRHIELTLTRSGYCEPWRQLIPELWIAGER